ncbi:MAG: DUF3443 family protein [Polyangia bacterium]
MRASALVLFLASLVGLACSENDSTPPWPDDGRLLPPGLGSSPGTEPSIASSGVNVLPIVVNAGPAYQATNPSSLYVNGAFASVTVCAPGTSDCQTIDGLLVDTGSVGLRILSSALTVSLADATSNGIPLSECTLFLTNYTYGPLKLADVTMAGETAANIEIQVIDATASVPSSCSGSGLPANDTLATLAANGILGIGPFLQDCGESCVSDAPASPAFYYTCPSAGCQDVGMSLAQQLPNPVASLAGDNNGIVIELPEVPAAGAATLSGAVVFGIGTRANNAFSGSTVLPLDSAGNFATVFQNVPTSSSFADTGSDGIFFADASSLGISVCPDMTSFYCPSTTQNYTAVLGSTGSTGSTGTSVKFSIANADDLITQNPTYAAYGNLGGPGGGSFDWGLPFFYGRRVFVALAEQATPAGPGPYLGF